MDWKSQFQGWRDHFIFLKWTKKVRHSETLENKIKRNSVLDFLLLPKRKKEILGIARLTWNFRTVMLPDVRIVHVEWYSIPFRKRQEGRARERGKLKESKITYLSVMARGSAVASLIVLYLVEPAGNLSSPSGLGVVRPRGSRRPGSSYVLSDREPPYGFKPKNDRSLTSEKKFFRNYLIFQKSSIFFRNFRNFQDFCFLFVFHVQFCLEDQIFVPRIVYFTFKVELLLFLVDNVWASSRIVFRDSTDVPVVW